uniref:Protein kinase domain-containing protein n=1 Tax=Lotharella globosa TaxID=91324 RepID=A0A6V3QRW4_9EUKA
MPLTVTPTRETNAPSRTPLVAPTSFPTSNDTRQPTSRPTTASPTEAEIFEAVDVMVTFPEYTFSDSSENVQDQFRNEFVAAMTVAMGVEQDDVKINSMFAGSTVVNATVFCNSSSKATLVKTMDPSEVFVDDNGFSTETFGPASSELFTSTPTAQPSLQTRSPTAGPVSLIPSLSPTAAPTDAGARPIEVDGGSGESNSTSAVIPAVASVLGVLFLASVAGVWWWCRRRKTAKKKEPAMDDASGGATTAQPARSSLKGKGSHSHYRDKNSSHSAYRYKNSSVDTKASQGSADPVRSMCEPDFLGQYVSTIRHIYKEDDIKLIRALGEGNFGVAHLGVLIPHGNRKVVVKIAKLHDVETKDTKRELKALCALEPHPNITEFIGVLMMDGKMCFVTEYCEWGSLDNLHRGKDLATPKRFLRVVDDVCSGLTHLHRHSILHRDLACRNLLMKRDGTVTLCDFGLSKKLLEDANYYQNGCSGKVPWPWTDPHSMYTGKFDYKSDVWSLGVTFWEILTRGGDPYLKEKQTMQFVRLINEIRRGAVRLKLPAHCHKEGRTIVQACLNLDRQSRLDANQIREMAQSMMRAHTSHYGCRVKLEEKL